MKTGRQLHVEWLKPKANPQLNILRLKGFINARTNRDFEAALDDVLAAGKVDLVLDMQDLEYLNSTGLSTMINYQQSFRTREREILIIHAPYHIAVIIHQMGLSEMIPLLKDEAEVMACLKRDAKGKRIFPQGFDYLKTEMPDSKKIPIQAKKKKKLDGIHSVLIMEPSEDEFTRVLKLRLHHRKIHFIVVHNVKDLLKRLEKHSPEVVILRYDDKVEKLIQKIKINLEHPLLSLTLLYPPHSTPETAVDFKIWENDFFVEPFDIMELFTQVESEIRRIQLDRKNPRRQLNYRFFSTENNINKASDLTKHLIDQSPLKQEQGTRLLSAFNEALDNARRHGHAGDPKKSIDVVYSSDGEQISIQISDEGPGFDFQRWTEDLNDTTAVKRAQKSKRLGQRGGLGILLMFKCCSRVSYHGSGNTLLLEQKIRS
jgi:serine/threonine-protein kinase RsbW